MGYQLWKNTLITPYKNWGSENGNYYNSYNSNKALLFSHSFKSSLLWLKLEVQYLL